MTAATTAHPPSSRPYPHPPPSRKLDATVFSALRAGTGQRSTAIKLMQEVEKSARARDVQHIGATFVASENIGQGA